MTRTCRNCGRSPRTPDEKHCGNCHSHFAGPRAFDRHQTLNEAGESICHDPDSDRGLIAVTGEDGPTWHLATVDRKRPHHRRPSRKK